MNNRCLSPTVMLDFFNPLLINSGTHKCFRVYKLGIALLGLKSLQLSCYFKMILNKTGSSFCNGGFPNNQKGGIPRIRSLAEGLSVTTC